MATFDTPLASGYTLRLEIGQQSQNQAGNSTIVSWALRILKGAGSGKYADGPHGWSVNIGGNAIAGSLPSYDFRAYSSLTLGSGQVNLSHSAAGYLTANFSGSYDDNNTWGELSDGNVAGSVTFTRIPKVPAAPTITGTSAFTPTSFRATFTRGDDMGSAIIDEQAHWSSSPSFNPLHWDNILGNGSYTDPSTAAPLTPGVTYYVRVRSRNAVGWSPWSKVVQGTPGLPAPTLTAVAQDAAGRLTATWSPPAVTTALVGYRVQVATNAAFTSDVSALDVGNVLTAAMAGLAGGRIYYVRVAARTAGGVNAYSESLTHLLVLSSGELDGWTRVGAKPATIAYFTAEGLRRGTSAGRQALWVESLSTGSATLAADTFGIQRIFTGLTVGHAYRFEAWGNRSGAPLGDAYRIRVINEATAAPVTLAETRTDLGFIEFVADATTVTVQLLLAETVVVTGAQSSVERSAFTDIKLLELNTDYPQRLRETVLESDLATHFDLACNSVGASWSVGKDGVTRFLLPGTSLPVSVVFSDEPDATAQSYIDINAGHDTRALTNRLVATNYGVDEARQNERNDELVVTSPASITAYGTRSQTLRVNLHAEPPYAESLNTRLAEILDARDQPDLLISKIRLNAQQDLALANALDIGQRVLVRFNGAEQDSQIIALTHDIQPTRWLITLDLQPL